MWCVQWLNRCDTTGTAQELTMNIIILYFMKIPGNVMCPMAELMWHNRSSWRTLRGPDYVHNHNNIEQQMPQKLECPGNWWGLHACHHYVSFPKIWNQLQAVPSNWPNWLSKHSHPLPVNIKITKLFYSNPLPTKSLSF